MPLENYLGHPLDGQDHLIQTCVTENDTGHQQPKNYSTFLNFMAIYMISLTLLFLVFFNTELKRTKADQRK